MSKVKKRMLEIVDSLPDDYFDNKSYNEMIILLVKRYLDKYGDDETTIIPGTDKHITMRTFVDVL